MRKACLVLVMLVLCSGCSTPAPPAAAQAATVLNDAPAAARVSVAFTIGSGMRVCAGPTCTFLGGTDPRYDFDAGAYTGFDLNVTIADDVQSSTLGPQRPVEFSVSCHAGGRGGCDGWTGVKASGTFPVRLQATGLAVQKTDLLSVTVRYIGADAAATHGSGARYDVAGTVTGVGLSPPRV